MDKRQDALYACAKTIMQISEESGTPFEEFLALVLKRQYGKRDIPTDVKKDLWRFNEKLREVLSWYTVKPFPRSLIMWRG